MQILSVKVASAVIAGIGLAAGGVGIVGAQVTGGIDTTGEESTNNATVTETDNRQAMRNANVTATNNNPQTAVSGAATVDEGDDDADAMSGNAGNDSTLNGDVTVDQAGGSGGEGNLEGGNGDATGTVANTGENSTNNLAVHDTDNSMHHRNANVNVTNNNTQVAQTGAATVNGGDDAGSATSGAANNVSDTTFTVNVQQ
jgi:hypothetical protein